MVSLPFKELINNICQTKDIKIIIEQLRELKQSFLNHSSENNNNNNSNSNNNDNQVTITSILKLLIENVLDNWYYAFTEFDKQLFESFFFLPNLLSESFITLTTLLSEYNNNNNNNNEELYSQKLNFLFNILYKFINDNNNNLSKLIIEFQNRKFKNNNSNSNNEDIDLEIHETIWNLIIKSICLIPDKCRSIHYYYKNNRIRNTQSPLSQVKDYILEFFTNNSLFYSKIIQQCIQSVNSSISSNLDSINNNNSGNNNNIHNIITLYSNQYSILFSKMIKIGEKDIIVNNFFKELFQDDNKNSSLILKRKLSCNIIIGIQGSCLDTFLETIIKSLSKYVFKLIFLEIFKKRNEISMIVHIMINKILILKVMDNNSQNCYLDLLYSILLLESGSNEDDSNEEDKEPLLFLILNNLLKSWKDPYFIRHCTNEQHSYITRSIIFFIEKLSIANSSSSSITIKPLALNKFENIKHLLLSGIDVHLKFTISNINNRGMFVAEQFSKLFNNNNSSEPLKFNYSLDTPDQQCFSLNFKPVFQDPSPTTNNNTTSNSTLSPSSSLSPSNSGNEKKQSDNSKENYKKLLEKEFKKYDDPDKIMNDDDEEEEEQEQIGPKITEINSDDEEEEGDDDDLKPYDLDDDESDLNGIKKKIYLRDCLLELQSQKHTAESWENALNSISSIVWSSPDDLEELSVQLTSSLIHLTNEYDLESFSSIRHESLVALATQSTSLVIPYLTDAFKQKNFSIGQRIEILETIAESAIELSGLNYQQNDQRQQQQQQQQEYQQQYKDSKNSIFNISNNDNNNNSSYSGGGDKSKLPIFKEIGIVRKWGQRKTPRPIIKSNRFHKFVKIYFYPLLSGFDKVTQCYEGGGVSGEMMMMGYDSFLLSRLIHTLGVIVECAGNSNDTRMISKELVRFLWSFKSHRDSNVRRSLLYSLSRVFYRETITKSVIDQDYTDEIEDIAQFLFEVSQSDSDKDSRVMAIATLSKIHHHQQQQQQQQQQLRRVTPLYLSAIRE
ncbi:hypothetical protein ACTFIU_004013 [Dictyostelium citrinum]